MVTHFGRPVRRSGRFSFALEFGVDVEVVGALGGWCENDQVECCPSLLTASLDAGSASELAVGFNALGDPVRLRLLSMLAAAPEGEICVCEFIQPIGKSQGTISHHVKILGDAGLVHGDRRGKWVWYSLDRTRLDELRSALDA